MMITAFYRTHPNAKHDDEESVEEDDADEKPIEAHADEKPIEEHKDDDPSEETQVENDGPVPVGKHRKSLERGSSIPAGKFSDFFR